MLGEIREFTIKRSLQQVLPFLRHSGAIDLILDVWLRLNY
jgi:hypothetical protein